MCQCSRVDEHTPWLVYRALFPEGAGCRMGERIFVPVSRRIESGHERSLPERKSESEQLSELVCWAVPKECIVRARTAQVSAMRDLDVKIYVQ